MPAMSPAVRNQWIADLRSGSFKQGHSYLKAYDSTNDTTKYCCLGVLAEQLSLLKEHKNGDLRWGVADSYGHICTTSFGQPESVGLSEKAQGMLIGMNDGAKMPFSAIADWIEHNL